MPLPNFIAKLFGTGGKELIDKGFDLIDNLTLSKEEKEQFKEKYLEMTNEHLFKMETLAQAETEAVLKDMENARNREIQIASSEKAPMLNKIIAPLLAAFVVFSTFLIWALILFRHYEPKTNEAIIIGALSAMTSSVLSYYFGSSIGSKEKSKQIEGMIK